MDNHLHWKNHIFQVLPVFHRACYAVSLMFHFSNFDVIKTCVLHYFHFIVKHGIIFRGNSFNIKKTFTVCNKIFRITVGARHRNLCNNVFKRMKMSPLHFNSYFC